MSNLKRQALQIPKPSGDTPEKMIENLHAAMNDRLQQIGLAIESQAGHHGVVKLKNHLDLNGFNIVNLGRPRGALDAVSVADVDAMAGPAAMAQSFNQFLGNLEEFDGAEDLFDLDPPGVINTLSLRWQKKGGWLARWEEPVGVKKIIGYFISFFNDASGTVWMNPDTGATVATQTLSERFIEEAHFRTGLSVENLDSPFSATGVKCRVIAMVKLKGHGRVRGPATDYGTLIPPFGDGADDTAEASAVQNLTLVWGAKKKGFKATWQPPATHWESKGKYYRVVYMNNAATHFMNPLTGALASPDTEAGGTIKVVDTHHTTHLLQSDLASDFAAGVKVKVTPVNTVNGVETISSNSSTSSFIAPGGENTAAPPAVNGLSLTWGHKKKGFKATWAIPSSQWFGEGNYYLVVYFDNGGTNFMQANVGTLASPNTEAGAQIKVYDTHHTTHLLQSDLATQFGSGVKVKVTPVNFVGGVETVGTSTTSSLVAPSGEDVQAPVISEAPKFFYKRGKFHVKLRISQVTNVFDLLKTELTITDGSSKSFNLDDLNSLTPSANETFYNIGKTDLHMSIAISRADVWATMGKTGTIYAKVALTNRLGTTISSASSTLDLATLKDVTTQYNPVNILRNGHLNYHDGTNAKHWQEYDPRSGAFANLAVTGKVRFDLDGHRIKWRDTPTVDNQRFAVQNRGTRFFRSEYYSAAWNVYSNGTTTIDEFVIGLYTQKTLSNNISGTASGLTCTGTGFLTDGVKVGTIIGENSVGQWRTVTAVTATSLTIDRAWGSTFGPTPGFALIPQATRLPQSSLALTTADLLQKGTMFTDSDLDTANNIYFVIILRDIVDTTTFPYVDAICLNAGQESAGYQQSVETFELNNAGTSENFDTQPTQGSSNPAQFTGFGTPDLSTVGSILS
jgi:hypothetical protein